MALELLLPAILELPAGPASNVSQRRCDEIRKSAVHIVIAQEQGVRTVHGDPAPAAFYLAVALESRSRRVAKHSPTSPQPAPPAYPNPPAVEQPHIRNPPIASRRQPKLHHDLKKTPVPVENGVLLGELVHDHY